MARTSKRTDSRRLPLDETALVIEDEDLTPAAEKALRAAAEIMQPIVDIHAEIARKKVRTLHAKSRKPGF